jgi:uncharacterized membrane protein (DUF441 family)
VTQEQKENSMKLNDKIIAAIRTFVPIIVGFIVTWVSKRGFIIDEETSAMLVSTFQAAVTALYWAIVTAVSKRWPQIQWLLGYAAAPEYKKVGQ